MGVWLIAAVERLPPRARRMVLAAAAVLLLVGAITSLVSEARQGGGGRRRAPVASRPFRPTQAHRLAPRVSPPVSAVEMRAARVVAARFLVSYRQFAYGRGSAGAVRAVTPGLRSQLISQRAWVTPAARGRHPRVVWLATVGTTPGFVVATATVADGGIVAYRLRFTVEGRAGRWLVSSVQEA